MKIVLIIGAVAVALWLLVPWLKAMQGSANSIANSLMPAPYQPGAAQAQALAMAKSDLPVTA